MSFEIWWFNKGSGIIPEKNEDHETHTKRVSEMAYQFAILEMHYRNAGNATVDSSVERYGHNAALTGERSESELKAQLGDGG